ncbi:unnamed protein product [Protopolystoma xenopodis]|uniref:Uncharacterized protein n=1 Tax=Protopolystoma xenopodis TaxID=117903 RepID=A0A3S5B7T6_9PLAT|nr:unnamed protein product [Protopolystoma xenopodis]
MCEYGAYEENRLGTASVDMLLETPSRLIFPVLSSSTQFDLFRHFPRHDRRWATQNRTLEVRLRRVAVSILSRCLRATPNRLSRQGATCQTGQMTIVLEDMLVGLWKRQRCDHILLSSEPDRPRSHALNEGDNVNSVRGFTLPPKGYSTFGWIDLPFPPGSGHNHKRVPSHFNWPFSSASTRIRTVQQFDLAPISCSMLSTRLESGLCQYRLHIYARTLLRSTASSLLGSKGKN